MVFPATIIRIDGVFKGRVKDGDTGYVEQYDITDTPRYSEVKSRRGGFHLRVWGVAGDPRRVSAKAKNIYENHEVEVIFIPPIKK